MTKCAPWYASLKGPRSVLEKDKVKNYGVITRRPLATVGAAYGHAWTAPGALLYNKAMGLVGGPLDRFIVQSL